VALTITIIVIDLSAITHEEKLAYVNELLNRIFVSCVGSVELLFQQLAQGCQKSATIAGKMCQATAVTDRRYSMREDPSARNSGMNSLPQDRTSRREALS
jgi:hypothetical protein